MRSITERLADKFGGTWVYDRAANQWVCTDGSKVRRVHRGGCDENGEAMPGVAYWLHEPSGLSYEVTL